MLFARQVADAWAVIPLVCWKLSEIFFQLSIYGVLYSGGGGEERMVQLLQVKKEEKQFVQLAIPN